MMPNFGRILVSFSDTSIGIYVLNQGGSVIFGDLNLDVLKSVTSNNVALNIASSELLTNARFFAGDWLNVADHLDTKFDLVLSAETLVCASSRVEVITTRQDRRCFVWFLNQVECNLLTIVHTSFEVRDMIKGCRILT